MSPNPFTFDSDIEAIMALEAEGRRLKKIATKLWRDYMSSYNPKVYVMTGKSERSIKLGKVRKLDAFTWGIELFFESELAYHPSVMTGGRRGHSIMLISEGWKNKNYRGSEPKYRFDYFDGINYIGRIIEEFNDSNRMGITLEVNWDGKPYKKKKVQTNVLK